MIEKVIHNSFLKELNKIAAYSVNGVKAPPKTPTPRMPGVLKKRPARMSYKPPGRLDAPAKIPGVTGPDYLP